MRDLNITEVQIGELFNGTRLHYTSNDKDGYDLIRMSEDDGVDGTLLASTFLVRYPHKTLGELEGHIVKRGILDKKVLPDEDDGEEDVMHSRRNQGAAQDVARDYTIALGGVYLVKLGYVVPEPD
jgi:hypothetical protein